MKSIPIGEHSQKYENSPLVGIFWLLPANIIDSDNVLLYSPQPLADAAHVDTFYDSTFEHYTLWNTVQNMFPQLKNTPYEKYPRGRITFVAKNYPQDGVFKLMADIQILRQKECLFALKRLFNMVNYKIEVLRDAHYRT